MQRTLIHAAALGALLGLAGACGDTTGDPSAGGPLAPSASGSSGAAPAPPVPAAQLRPITLTGGAIAAAADDRTLIIADEDHEALFVVPASAEDAGAAQVLPMPGPPAQVVDAGDAVFVTIRTLPTPDARDARAVITGPAPEPAAMSASVVRAPKPAASASASASAIPAPSARPGPSAARSASAKPSAKPTAAPVAKPKPPRPKERGTKPLMFDPLLVRKSEGGLLLVLARDDRGGLREASRLILPVDAWGIALSPDRKRAIVTSAWASKISILDVADRARPAIVATLDSAREPRGVTFKSDGSTAYVSHLVGSALTRIDGVAGASPTLAPLDLPAGQSRAPVGVQVAASLGYSVVLSPDDRTLFAPRHALGADGIGSWWGAPVVDTLDLASGKPLQPKRQLRLPRHSVGGEEQQVFPAAEWTANPGDAPAPSRKLTQPRAAVYRTKSNTLLVASEGEDAIAELDARLPDPAMRVVDSWKLGEGYDKFGDFPKHGGAPSGLALSRDESALYVLCRTTFDLVRIGLDDRSIRRVHLAEDGLPVDAAYGRRLFYNAASSTLSGGLGCAACHPDGRDDGYVWREGDLGLGGDRVKRFVANRAILRLNGRFGEHRERRDVELFARQTPMIAGRMRAGGPYAWHAEDENLLDRLNSGFTLHRAGWDWASDVTEVGQDVAKVDYLADFLRSGLLPPPAIAREPSDAEKKGKEIFESKKAACSSCHVPQTEFTDRSTHGLHATARSPEFADESTRAFKTPSLFFVAGSAPFFHDGSAATLEELVEKNGTRMGSTAHLSAEEKSNLVAYLRTL